MVGNKVRRRPGKAATAFLLVATLVPAVLHASAASVSAASHEDGNLFIANISGSNGVHGISLSRADGNEVIGNVFTGNGGNGVTVAFGQTENVVKGNTATGNTVDLVDGNGDCDDTTWGANNSGTAHPGCSGTATPTPVTVCGTVIGAPGVYELANNLNNCPATGIQIQSSNVDLLLGGHTVDGTSTGAGIDVIDVGNPAGLSNVRIIGPGTVQQFDAGIVFGNVHNSRVDRLTITGNGHGVAPNSDFTLPGQPRSSNNVFSSNVVTGNSAHGFTLNGSNASLFIANQSSGNSGHGFLLYRADNNEVVGNVLTGNGLIGVTAAAGQSGNLVRGNAVSANSTDLSDSNGDCTTNTWEANTFGTSNPACIGTENVPPTPVTTCGAVLGAAGVYALGNDLIDCPGHGIQIQADDVTLLLGGFSVDGTGGGFGIDVAAGGGPTVDAQIVGPGSVTQFDIGIRFENVQLSHVARTTVTGNDHGVAVYGDATLPGSPRSTDNQFSANDITGNIVNGFTVDTPPGPSPLSFFEDFSGGSLPGNMNTSGPGTVTFNGSTATFPAGGDANRTYLRTNEANYAAVDFIAEVTMFVASDPANAAITFLGMGVGTPGLFGTPDAPPAVFAEIRPTNFFPSFFATSNPPRTGFAACGGGTGGDGTHRMRMTWDASAQTATFVIDQNYSGGTFVADCTLPPVDGSALGFGEGNSRIFIGGASSLAFDDLLVVADPAPPPPPPPPVEDPPPLAWAVANAADRSAGVGVDDAGNSYVAVGFSGTKDFDPGPGVSELTSNGSWDVAVAKFGPAGEFLWAKSWGNAGNDQVEAIAVDADGSVYTTGSWGGGTVDFDPGPGVFTLPDLANDDAWVSKLDADGNFVWAVSVSGGGHDTGRGLAVDGLGNVVATGNLGFPLPATAIVTKIDGAGNTVWSKSWVGAVGYGTTVAGDGSVYVTGRFFSATADFDPGPGTVNLPFAGANDVFLSKFRGDGEFVWARGWGSSADDGGYDVEIDALGSIYVGGYFNDTVDFDPGAGTEERSSAGLADAFVSQFDASGGLQWAAAWGGTGSEAAADLAPALGFAATDVPTPQILVDTTADNATPGDATCTLREAINNANADADTTAGDCTAGSGVDTITFVVSGSIPLGSRLPNITDDLTIDGIGQSITIDGQSAHQVIVVTSTNTLDLRRVTIANGLGAFCQLGTTCGAVVNEGILNVSEVTFINNYSQNGGAITSINRDNHPPGPVAIPTDGTLSVVNSAFIDNSALYGGGAIFNAWEGTVSNSTFNGNSSGAGGAIYNYLLATITVTNTTFWGNQASGGVFQNAENATLYNTVIGASIGNNCSTNAGPMIIDASNLADDATCGSATVATSPDIGVLPIADNGGLTQTIALNAGSLAIDAGDATQCAAAQVDGRDQRGVSRSHGAGCDVGAFEYTAPDVGSVYATGQFSGTVDFQPGDSVFELTSSGSFNPYLTALSDAGYLVWAGALNGPPGTGDGRGVAVGTDGALYGAGTFSSTIDADPGANVSSITAGDGLDVYLVRLGGAAQVPPDLIDFTYSVADDSGTPGITQVGVGAVPITQIPIESIVGANGPSYESAPLGSIPLGSIPLGSIDLKASPLGSIPLGSIPLGSIDVSASPLGSIPLGSIPLGSIGGWETLLAGTELEGIPLQSVTLGEVLALSPAPAGIADVDLNDIAVEDSPLGSISLPSVALGDQDLLTIDPTACDDLVPLGLPAPCDDPNTDTLFELEIAAAPLGSIPLGSIPLGSIPLGSIPLGSIPLGSIPLGSIPLGSIPLGSIPLGSIDLLGAPLGSIPLGSIPLGSIPLGSIPLGSIDLAGTPLGSIPLGSIGTTGACDELVAPLDCATLGVDPLGDLLELVIALEAEGESIVSTPLGSIPLGSIPLGSIPLGSIELGATPLGSIPLGSIELAQAPLGSIPLGSIGTSGGCAEVDCVALGLDDTSKLFEYVAAIEPGDNLETSPLGSIPLGSIPLGSIPLGSIDMATVEVNGAPLGSIPLGSIGLGDTGIVSSPLGSIPLGSIPLGSIDLVVDCGQVDCIGATLGDAVLAGALQPGATLGDLGVYGSTTLGDLDDLLTMELLYGPSDLGTPGNDYGDLTFGQILVSMLLQSDFPWETLPLRNLGLQEVAPTGTVTYSAAFELTGDGTGLGGVLTARMPAEFLFVPGSARLVTGLAPGVDSSLPDPAMTELGSGQIELSFDLTLDAGETYAVEWEAVPGFSIGTALTGAEIDFTPEIPAPSGPVADVTLITVEEYFTGNNDFSSPTAIAADALVFSHTATPYVSDFFSFDPGPVGTRHAVFVSQFDQDTDLVLYKPATKQVSEIEPRSIPLDAIPLEDDGIDYGLNATEEPELQADMELEDEPLGDVSVNRGTEPEAAASTLAATPLTPGDPFTIQVNGYQGKASPSPYVVRVRREQVVSAPACTPLGFPHAPAGGVDLGTLPAGLNTIVLFNSERIAHQYSAAEAASIQASIDALIASGANGVVGATIDIADDPAVQAAYANWDPDPCDVERANDVVGAITSLIDDIQTAHPTLAYVTIIGSDDIVPFARMQDLASIANESTYVEQFSDGALYGALSTRHYLSDDPYGDIDPIRWLDRRLHMPEISVGRLVETPADIVRALDNYVAFDGLLDPETAAVAGYDFLDDGSNTVFDRLANIYGALNTANLIDAAGLDPAATWTRSALLDFLDLTDASPGSDTADIFTVNAHSDHYRQLPSFGDANHEEVELFSVDDLNPLPDNALSGNVVFTMGCHAGLSVSDIGVVASQTIDWAQKYSSDGALYIANSGYGYGDTASVALSERLMAEFAENLNGTMTVGQAMTFAKQEYFAQLGQYGPYDEKAMQQVIFYGLPMYSVGATPPPEPPPPLPTALYPAIGLKAATIDFAPTYTQTTIAGEGIYFSIDGQVQNTHYRPLQPVETFDVTQPDLLAHGGIVTEATTTDLAGVDPVFFRPNVTGAAQVEPEAPTDEIATELFGVTIATYNAPGTGPNGEPFAQRQQATLVAGSFVSPADGSQLGVQRQIDTAEVLVIYADPSATDYRPPPISTVDSTLIGNQVSFTISSSATDVAQALVLYRKVVSGGVSTWVTTPLVADPANPGSFSGGGPVDSSAIIGGGVDFKVWLIDTAGNVSTSDNKNLLWKAEPPPPPQAASGFSLDVPPPDVGAWHTGPVTVTLTGEPGVTYSITGGSPAVIVGSGTFDVTGEGYNDVSVTGGGETATVVILIDSTDPLAVVDGPADGSVLGQTAPHVFDFECLDAGSGIQTCTALLDGVSVEDGDIVDTATPGVFILEVTAVDAVGNSSSTTISYRVNAAPVLVADDDPVVVNEGTTAANTGTATDAGGDPVALTADVGVVINNGDGTWAWSLGTDDGPTASQSVTITGDDGVDAVEVTFDLTVDNVAPTATFSDDGPVDEGLPFELALTGPSDPSTADTTAGFEYAFDCGDGSGYGAFGVSPSASCATDDDGTRNVKAKIRDTDLDETEYTATVTVNNVAPTATLSDDGPVDEGSSFELALTAPSDSSTADTTAGFEYAFDCGDGYGAFGTSASATCATDDDGARAVKAKIRDKDLDETEYTATVTVNNVAPTATLSDDGPVDEGSSFELSLTAPSDPSTADTTAGFEYAFDCGDGLGYGAFGVSPSASCATDDDGTRNVKAKIRDDDGGEIEYTATVTVNNVAPTIGAVAGPAEPVALTAQPVTVDIEFTDPGSADTHDVTWDWGDGSTPDVQSAASGPTVESHTYATAGVYEVTVTVTDDDAGSDVAVSDYVVIYDGTGKKYHGNGKHDLGAADLKFGLEAKPSNSAPFVKGSGKVEVKPHNGDPKSKLMGDSLTSLYFFTDWAIAHGIGAWVTDNVSVDVEFLVAGSDGQSTGNADTVRVKIWRQGMPTMVLVDTQPGASHFAYPTLVPDDGEIKIKYS